MRSGQFSRNHLAPQFDQRRLKNASRARIPQARGAGTLWGIIFLPNLDSDSLFAARTLAQALSEHVLRPHLTVLLVSLQHTLRYFGSWDAMARVYHAQVQHLPPGARPRLLLTHHLFAGTHFGATHTDLEFALANENNLMFRNHLSTLTWPQWKEACVLFASLLQLKQSELTDLLRSVKQFADAALSMRFQSPAHFPTDLNSDDISRRFGRWVVVFWDMWNRPEVALGTVFKDLPQDLCAQDFVTHNNECEEYSNDPCYPLSTLQPMLETCLKKLLRKLTPYNSLEQHFGIRDFRVTLEVENNLKIQHTCMLNEAILEFNKTTRLVLENMAAKLPHKGQEFQHPTEPSFYFKAFQIYRLTIEPLRLCPCGMSAGSELHSQRTPLPFERVIQNIELKHAGDAFQVPLHADFSTASHPEKQSPDLLESAHSLQILQNKRVSHVAPACLFRFAAQERPLHLLRKKLEFSLCEFFSSRDAPVHHLEYLETLYNEDLYALHAPGSPALLLSCPQGETPATTRFTLKGVFEPAQSALQERFF
ncbi:hypothetical protein EBU99_06470 [bacterium]|nr:hypothetical protein [bacterium]